MYTIMGIAFIIGWIVIKTVTIFMGSKDKREINSMYRSFKPDRKDWN